MCNMKILQTLWGKQYTLKRALVSTDIPAQLEPAGLDRNDNKRPDGATIIPWTNKG